MQQFNINEIIEVLKSKRKLFVSEADFQFEIAMVIKEMYPEAKVLLEYPLQDLFQLKDKMNLDILVIFEDEWIPIELKYITRTLHYREENIIYYLKNQGTTVLSCYDCLKDIERIELVKEKAKNENEFKFKEGYTIQITNDPLLTKPLSKNAWTGKNFSLEDGIEKSGKLSWHEKTSDGTKSGGREESINLQGEYKINWKEYSKIDDISSRTFYYLINKIK